MKNFQFIYERGDLIDDNFEVTTFSEEVARQIAVLLVYDKYNVAPAVAAKYLKPVYA